MTPRACITTHMLIPAEAFGPRPFKQAQLSCSGSYPAYVRIYRTAVAGLHPFENVNVT